MDNSQPASPAKQHSHNGELAYLRSLESIRARCRKVYDLVKEGKSSHFTLDESHLDSVVLYIINLMKRDYPNIIKDVPPHGRWRHFLPGSVEDVIAKREQQGSADAWANVRMVLDLFIVSVLLDAGAGNVWSYVNAGKTYTRSEGLAIASFDMFCAGVFSSDPANPLQVDADGLKSLSVDTLARGLQVDEVKNPLVGLQGRCDLLHRLGDILKDDSLAYFAGTAPRRPGNLIDYLRAARSPDGKVDIDVLWEVAMVGFGRVWPESRTRLDGVSLGDVWPCELLAQSLPPSTTASASLVTFHKLSQWLVYSLMEPIERLSPQPIAFCGVEKMTGLAEYRNGGLFVDFGVIVLSDSSLDEGLERARQQAKGSAGSNDQQELVPAFPVDHAAIVEWRALTVILLDRAAETIRMLLGAVASPADAPLINAQLTLPKILEGGTWKAGREIAARARPKTKSPPISVISDGTVF